LINETRDKGKLQFLTTRNINQVRSAFRITMGVMPDYAFDGTGMRIDGVTNGKPAQLSGLEKGDVLIRMGDDDIRNVEGYMKALAKVNKGDTIKVKVMRQGKAKEVEVTF
jgi:S1-C subfamily serine protease